VISNIENILRDTPCETREELKQWLLNFLDVDLPDCIVDKEHSNCTPFDMVWLIYNSALRTQDITNALFIANRSGSKTFGAAVLEFLLLQHDKRSITHIGAIEKQAKRAYQYFQEFYRRDKFKDFVDKMIMEKTIVKNRGTFEILPCTLSACNDPNSLVKTQRGTLKIKDVEIGDKLLSFNKDSLKFDTYREVESKREVIKPCYKITTKDTEFIASSNHMVLSKCGWINVQSLIPEKHHLVISDCIQYNISKEYTYKVSSFSDEDVSTPEFVFNLFSGDKEKYVSPNLLPRHDDSRTYRKWRKKFKELDYTIVKGKTYLGYYPTIEIKLKGEDFFNCNFWNNSIVSHNCNGPHTPLVCKDEVDTVQDLQAYKDISGIPIPTLDGRPPITIGISTRKSSFGLVQQEVDAAAKTGLQVFKWGILECTQKCTIQRSGTRKIPIYININKLLAIDEETWKALPFKQKTEYTSYTGYEGCLKNCKIFAACRGYLKQQTCTSPYLRSIDLVQKQLFETSEDWALAQQLCIKPSPTGLVYSNFNYSNQVLTYKQIIEKISGQVITPNKEITLDDVMTIAKGFGCNVFMGIDFGFTDPYVAELMVIDKIDNIYVVKEFAVTQMDGDEAALWLQNNWAKYEIDMVYPDIENPGYIKLLIKRGFNCAKALKDKETTGGRLNIVNKDIKGGIETVRRFIRVPGTHNTKLFINHSCKLLLEEIQKYHYRTDRFGNVIDDTPEDESNHACFVDGTMIRMADGSEKNIVDVCVGEKVATPIGPKEVIFSGKTGEKEVIKICAGMDHVICTKDHPVYFEGQGFVAARDFFINRRRIYKWNAHNILFLKESSIGGMAFIMYLWVGALKVGLGYTLLFGKNTMVRCRKGIMSIIKILMQGTALKIWNYWKQPNIRESTQSQKNEMGNGSKKLEETLKKRKKPQKNGTRSIGRILLEKLNRLNMFVKFVAKNIKARLRMLKEVNFVRIGVGLSIEGIWGLIVLKRFVQSAIKSSKKTNIVENDFVLVNALQHLSGTQSVYNLKIKGAGCFFANNFLVSNCDALRYVLNSRYGHREVIMEYDAEEEKTTKDLHESSSITEISRKLGIPFNDNSEIYEERKKELEKKEEVKTHLGIQLDKEEQEEEDGFSFTF